MNFIVSHELNPEDCQKLQLVSTALAFEVRKKLSLQQFNATTNSATFIDDDERKHSVIFEILSGNIIRFNNESDRCYRVDLDRGSISRVAVSRR